ncbi:MAG: GerMN domain-containing protein [Syntrophomonadaceae bacterium]
MYKKKRNGFTLFIIFGLLLIAIVLGGCQSSSQADPNNNNPPEGSNKPQPSTIEAVLYFSDEQAEYLVPEKRTLAIEEDNDEVLAKAIINELIAGPRNENLGATIPANSKLLSLTIQDGLATVDFSEEIRSEHWGGSTGETMTINSIVNTLTEIDSIDRVQLLIAGQNVDTLAGHWDISEPFERNEAIIKK